jgi:mannose-6-phosphate isomerase-like protein (cupin superfamily)
MQDMKQGQTIQLHRDEQITCLRSGADGGRFEFEMRLGPGVDGPPMHSHAEGPERIEVIAGAIKLIFGDGERRILGPGEALDIPAGQAHTFRNPSKTETLIARGAHGHRFERSMDQFAPGGPSFTRLCRYLIGVDPQATYMRSPVVRATMRVVALVGRVRGVQIV